MTSESSHPDRSLPRKGAIWWCAACLASTVGFVTAIAEWGWQGPVAGAIGIALVVAVVVAPFKVDDGLAAVPGIARTAVAAGLIPMAVAGLIAAFELAGLLVVLVLVVSMPGLAAHLREQWRRAARPHSARAPDPPTRHSLVSLDDDALCLAWRRSYRRLETARSALERLSVVEQRQDYLDELQRRFPEGLASWLASGARASGDPRPYLRDHRSQAG